jgi:hypothetical protein
MSNDYKLMDSDLLYDYWLGLLIGLCGLIYAWF